MSATFSVLRHPAKDHLRNKDFHISRFKTAHYGKPSMRYFGPYIWSRLDSKAKDKSSLQSFKSSIRHTNLVTLISDNCGSCIICSS